jgi:hypothetical protein
MIMPFPYEPTPPKHKHSSPRQDARENTHPQPSYNPPRDLLSEILEEEAHEQEARKRMSPAKPYQPTVEARERPSFPPNASPNNRIYGNPIVQSAPTPQSQNAAKASITNTPQFTNSSIETVLLLHPTLRIPVSVKNTLIDNFIKQGYQPIADNNNTP